ncbi:MAG: MFS transporter [Planctomycetes bacterium]|nr:MFS transporter [Planctomycetota bacterium]
MLEPPPPRPSRPAGTGLRALAGLLGAGGRAPGRLRRDLRAIFADGVSFSVMVGIGESYLVAFGLAVGLEPIGAALLGSLPMLVGALLQLVAPHGVRWLGSYRRWVVLCAGSQAASFLPLAYGAVRGGLPSWVLFLVAGVYWGTGMGTGPAWNTWVGRLVPPTVRPLFFALRTRAAHTATFLGLVAGGLVLQAAAGAGRGLDAFALLFLLAGAARALSAFFLSRQSEPADLPPRPEPVPVAEFVRRFRHGRDGRVVAYMLAAQLAIWVAAPFYTPYMLRDLGLSYASFMLLLALGLVGRAVSLPLLGRWARRAGVGPLLWLGGIGIGFSSMFWALTESLWLLGAAQVFAGVVWSAYELATFLLFFDAIEERERTSFLTLYNLAAAVVIVIGSLVGGALFGWLGGGSHAYHVLFFASGALRLGVLPLLARIRPAAPRRALPDLQLRPLAVRAGAGAIERPVLATLEGPPEIPDPPLEEDGAGTVGAG